MEIVIFCPSERNVWLQRSNVCERAHLFAYIRGHRTVEMSDVTIQLCDFLKSLRGIEFKVNEQIIN